MQREGQNLICLYDPSLILIFRSIRIGTRKIFRFITLFPNSYFKFQSTFVKLTWSLDKSIMTITIFIHLFWLMKMKVKVKMFIELKNWYIHFSLVLLLLTADWTQDPLFWGWKNSFLSLILPPQIHMM